MDYYSANAEQLIRHYNSLDTGQVHAAWLKHLPKTPGLACDIGAGSGRDANWLAGRGLDVIAVAPNKVLRETARQSSHQNVTWQGDKLPELLKPCTAGHRFNLIMRKPDIEFCTGGMNPTCNAN